MPLSSAEVDGLRIGLAATAFGFGLRHGIDWDHLAAIADVAGTQESPRRAMGLATLYAAGHGAVVFALGLAAIFGGHLLPAWLDAAMERLVGLSLVALAVAVAWSLARHRESFRMRSRWLVLAAGASRAVGWARGQLVEITHDHEHDETHGHVHDHDHLSVEPGPAGGAVAVDTHHHHAHRHVAPVPADPFAGPSGRAATLIGMLHGVGAETPTQVVLFLTAAHVAGTGGAVVLLGLFIAGVFVSNTGIALTASYGYLNAHRSFRAYVGLAIVNAGFSLVVGLLLLLGRSSILPPILGG